VLSTRVIEWEVEYAAVAVASRRTDGFISNDCFVREVPGLSVRSRMLPNFNITRKRPLDDFPCTITKGESNLKTLSASRDGGTDGGPESGESEKEPTPELVVSSEMALYLDADMVIQSTKLSIKIDSQ
jgi:hypothetical protein